MKINTINKSLRKFSLKLSRELHALKDLFSSPVFAPFIIPGFRIFHKLLAYIFTQFMKNLNRIAKTCYNYFKRFTNHTTHDFLMKKTVDST